MADYSMYHTLGQQDENNPNVQTQPAPPRFQPPVAPHPQGYQQGGGGGGAYGYGNAPGFQGNGPPAGSPGGGAMGMPPQGPPGAAYGAQGAQGFPPSRDGTPYGPDGSGLAGQMGNMNLGEGQAQPPPRAHKKKDRHAYHTLDSGAGQGPPGGQGQFVQQNQQQPLQPGQAFGANASPQPGQHPGQQGLQQPGQNVPFNPAATTVNADMGAVGSSAQGRVDPDQIPSVPRSRDVPAEFYTSNVYPTLEKFQPPPATIPFVAHDQGNSSPKYTRLTLNNLPATQEALSSTGLPLGLVLQPLAPQQLGEPPIPVLDFGETGPPRCRRCRAYINPFMTFRSGGNKFVCNMCTFPNDVPPEYFSPTTPQGVRVDRDQRPELTRGTVEFLVPKEYWAKEPVGIRWLFLIDVTQESFNKGYLESFCEGILSALYAGESESSSEEKEHRLPPGAKVGIVTYDKDIHFFNLSPHLDKAQMLVMPDVEDPFVPLSEGFFVDPVESKEIITNLLNQLPDIFSTVKNPEPALLSSLNSALSALTPTGGKVICSLSALPTWGPGRLFLRDDGKVISPDAEKKLFQTEHPGWRKVSEKMVQSGIGVDFFLAAPSGGYLDIATVGHVSAATGGETFYYPNFHAPRDTLKLSKEVTHAVNRATGYQALMKVRCSNGLQVASYHGNFVQHTFGADLEFGVIDEDKAMGVVFNYDGKLDAKLDAHFQSALLYTTATGQRRVRCSNVVASVVESGREAMRFVDQDAVVNIIAKEAATRMTERSLKDIRAGLSEKTVDILAGYRKNFSGSHPPGQLVLPENLKEVGMYTLSLIKCRAFKGGRESSDRRTHDMRMLKTMGATELALYLYPRIIPIHNLTEGDGFPDDNGHLRVPPSIRASFSRVEEGGAYIVDDGQSCLLWFHQRVSPNLVADLFGDDLNELASLDPTISSLPVLDTHLNAQVRNLLQYLMTVRGSKGLTIQLARQGIDGAEYEFARLLLEDRNSEAQSYVDWLVHVHRQIQLEIAGQRKKDDSAEGSTLGNFAGMRPPYW